MLPSSSSHLKNSCLINPFNNWAYPASMGCHMSVALATPYHTKPRSASAASLKPADFWASRLSPKRTKWSSSMADFSVFLPTRRKKEYQPMHWLENIYRHLGAMNLFQWRRFASLFLWRLWLKTMAEDFGWRLWTLLADFPQLWSKYSVCKTFYQNLSSSDQPRLFVLLWVSICFSTFIGK